MESDDEPTEQSCLITAILVLLFPWRKLVRKHKQKIGWEKAKKKLGDNMRKLGPVEESDEVVDKTSRTEYKTFDRKNDALIRDMTRMLERDAFSAFRASLAW